MNQYIIPPELQIRLIGIHGKAGVGKSTFAGKLMSVHQPVMTFAFAAPLKYACAAAFGICIDNFYIPEEKEKKNDFWGVSPREIAQFVGTEFFRDQIDNLLKTKVGNDFWIKRLCGILIRKLEDPAGMLTDFSNFTIIIEDVRFQNEIDFITANDGHHVIIHRPLNEGDSHEVGIPNHRSEAGNLIIPAKNRTYFNNKDSLEDFLKEIDDYAVGLGLTPF